MGDAPPQEGDGVGQICLTGDGFKGAVCLFTHQKGSMAKPGYLGGIFGHFGALRGRLTNPSN